MAILRGLHECAGELAIPRYGNEQNSQFESTVAVLNGNIIVAYVDSNENVYGLGSTPYPTNAQPPQGIGYAVSSDGGITFQDMGVPPLNRPSSSINEQGVAADPVLAVDEAVEIVYLIGTSPRNQGNHGIPVWKSTDGGVTFEDNPQNVMDAITHSDKPWISVDNYSGTGQQDVYVTCLGQLGSGGGSTNGVWFTVSTDGSGSTWASPQLIEQYSAAIGLLHNPIIIPSAGHTNYAFWSEKVGTSFPAATNRIRVRQIRDRGATVGTATTVVQLKSTYDFPDKLKRSNSAPTNDFFTAPTFLCIPVIDSVHPERLYVTFADRGTNATDKADVYLIRSSDAGSTWTDLQRINRDSTTNDQWMPTLVMKPDGTHLLISWYDRRNDTNNSLIDFYGRFGTIASDGAVTLTDEFKITTTNFPPVFGGETQKDIGDYDPVWPPGGVTLEWWYGTNDWPLITPGLFRPTLNNWSGHVGEYNGASSDGTCVYLTWTDNRLLSNGTAASRNQPDIRFVKINWPE